MTSYSKGNIIIANFMLNGQAELYVPQYHEDWNWLMGVIKRISSMEGKIETRQAGVNFYLVLSLDIDTEITDVWKSVLTFINWYNKAKKLGFPK